MNRFEKIDWLRENCSQEFLQNNLLDELVQWMGEAEFDRFYKHLCGCWGIARTSNEREAQMNDLEYDEESDEVITEWVKVS